MAKPEPKKKHSLPLPEALTGDAWKITPSPVARMAALAPEQRKMLVPTGQDVTERLVRAHEMTHISISPIDDGREGFLQGLNESVVQLCEDSRVHAHMRKLDFPVESLNVLGDDDFKNYLEEAPLAIAAAFGAAAYRTGEAVAAEGWLARQDPVSADSYAAYRAGRTLANRAFPEGEETPGFERTIELAKAIIDLFGDPDTPPPPPPPFGSQHAAPANQPISQIVPPKMARAVAPLMVNQTNDEVHGEEGIWAAVKFEEPPRPLHLPGRMRKRRKNIADVRGRRLRRLERLTTDGRVFAHKQMRKGGGAVLIDTSGSMSLTHDEVIALCVAFPGGVIAAYSAEGSLGYLRVIARNGRRVTDEMINPPGGGNEIDGPALDWLALQPGPRYWISDAGVSGGAQGLKYCLDVCVRARIRRVENAWEIVGKVEGV